MKVVKKLSFSILFIIGLNVFSFSQVDLNRIFKPTIIIKLDSSYKKLYTLPIKKYTINDLPFFCRMEEVITQRSSLNLRFRLGSLAYVNELENKN